MPGQSFFVSKGDKNRIVKKKPRFLKTTTAKGENMVTVVWDQSSFGAKINTHAATAGNTTWYVIKSTIVRYRLEGPWEFRGERAHVGGRMQGGFWERPGLSWGLWPWWDTSGSSWHFWGERWLPCVEGSKCPRKIIPSQIREYPFHVPGISLTTLQDWCVRFLLLQ